MSNLSKPIEFAHLQKLANHKKLNGAHMTEVTNACIAVLTKARNSIIFWSIEKPEKRTTEKNNNRSLSSLIVIIWYLFGTRKIYQKRSRQFYIICRHGFRVSQVSRDD